VWIAHGAQSIQFGFLLREILGLTAARVPESVADDSDFKTLIFTGLFEDRR
jgi:hypothetical protein